MQGRCARALLVVVMAGAVAACGDDAEVTEAAAPNPTQSTNHPPIIGGDPETSVVEGEAYSFKPLASDPDGDELTFSVTGKPAWMEFDPETGEITGSPNGKDRGKHKGIRISVSDGQAEATLDPIDIDVLPPEAADNTAPEISGSPAGEVVVGDAYDFVPTAADVDGDALLFSVENGPPWTSFDTATGRLSGTPSPAHVGVYANVVIAVSDPFRTTALDPFTIVVNPEPSANAAPTIAGTPATSVLVGAGYSFTPAATDPDGDPLSFVIVNRPSWASFNTTTGRLSGTPAAAHEGVYSGISIMVSDGEATASLPSFRVEVIAPNSAPTIGGTPPASVTAGEAYRFTPSASDADSGDSLTFGISNRPSWATFDATTGTLSGTPDAGDIATYANVTITVSDGQAGASLGPFSIEVVAANRAPTISGAPPTSVTVGELYSFTPVASDADGNSLTFSVTNAPTWASFDSTNGRLSGTPGSGDVGTHSNIVIGVTDGEASASLAAFAVIVNAPTPPNTPPTISGTPASSVLAGEMFSFTPTASDADPGDTLTFNIVNRPSWAVFDTTTGTLSGTPDAADVGTYANIRITVSDGLANAVLGPFSVTVNDIDIGTATLTWEPPTENTDGSALENLAAFTVYWGTVTGDYPNSVTLNNPGLTSYVVEGLARGTTYFFTVTAINSEGVESVFSNEASKLIQ